jgi:hypothetical protein
LPKISSKLDSNGIVTSNPIHEMDPPLSKEISEIVFKFMPVELIPKYE